MDLRPDQTVLHYRIVEKIGEGGMGVVWRATDTSLNRDVAIKVLPGDVAKDGERLQRFEREARTLAAVQHPNIATVYGLHECDGLRFLAMELIPGEDLAERLERGPLGTDEALTVARQIVLALTTAHERGVVHRDLKPANVRIGADGTVKVLDFGLAKVAVADTPASTSPTLSPTVTSLGTIPGVILGTAAYMAPEQAKAKPADRRADIWGLGVILFEMLTGRRLFAGETISETLAAVLKDEPDWKLLPDDVPPSVRRLLRRCLVKDPALRLRDAGDALLELDEPDDESGAARATGADRRLRTAWSVAVAAGLLALVLGVFAVVGGGEGEGTRPLRAAIPAPVGVRFDLVGDFGAPPVVSPDGRRVCFGGFGEERRALYVRSLDDGSVSTIPGTEGATFPFWSPDGNQLGFFAEGQLQRVEVGGGAPIVLARAPNGRGGSWAPDGTIVYSPDFREDLYRVSAAGGSPEPVVRRDLERHTTFRWPWFLPDGKHLLYLAAHHLRSDDLEIRFASLDGSVDRKVVTANSNPQYTQGQLLYSRGSELVVQSFDPDRGETTGPVRNVVQPVFYDATTWRTPYSVSRDGRLLVYAPGDAFVGSQLTWFDPEGKLQGTLGDRVEYGDLKFSPDGKRLVLNVVSDLWIYDLERGSRMRFTFDEATESAPVWSADGRTIYYDQYDRADLADRIYRRASSGASEPELVVDSPDPVDVTPVGVTPDERLLLYLRGERPFITNTHLWALPLDGGDPYALEASEDNVDYAALSPDGRWLAFSTTASTGTREIYVAPFDLRAGRIGDGRWQISEDSGYLPAWRGDGKELYFSGDDLIFRAVTIETTSDGELRFSSPRELFRAYVQYVARSWDVTPDGSQFLVESYGDRLREPLELVVGWSDLIEDRKR